MLGGDVGSFKCQTKSEPRTHLEVAADEKKCLMCSNAGWELEKKKKTLPNVSQTASQLADLVTWLSSAAPC